MVSILQMHCATVGKKKEKKDLQPLLVGIVCHRNTGRLQSGYFESLTWIGHFPSLTLYKENLILNNPFNSQFLKQHKLQTSRSWILAQVLLFRICFPPLLESFSKI